MTITKRGTKGSALTYNEMDENIRDLYEDTTINRVFTNASGSGSDVQHLTYAAPSNSALNDHDDPGFITVNYNTRLKMAQVDEDGESFCCANMLDMKNHNIIGVNHLAFSDSGPSEGLIWDNTKIFESPDDLTTNGPGNLQFIYDGNRKLTVNTHGIDVVGTKIQLTGANPELVLKDTNSTESQCVIKNHDGTLDLKADVNSERSNTRIRFYTDGTQHMELKGGLFGIGVTSPLAKLHVRGSNSSATDVADGTLIVEQGSAPSIQILSANTQTQSIKFGDPEDGDVGKINYSHATNHMALFTDGTEAIRIDSSQNVGIGTSPTEKLDIDGDSIRLRQSQTPASASATGTQGQIAWDANYMYVCTATDTWKRAALSTW